MRMRISVFMSQAALRHSQRCAAAFSIFTVLCPWKAIIRALAFMHSFHKNHTLATRLHPLVHSSMLLISLFFSLHTV